MRGINKGITPVIAIILLLLITISIVGFSFMFFQRTTETASQSGEEQLKQQTSQAGTQLRIEAASPSYEISVRNTGTNKASNIAVYVDGKPATLENPAITIEKGEMASIKLDGSSLPSLAGDHKLEVKSAGFGDNAKWDYLVVALVQDSSCSCMWTQPDCSNWWISQLKGKKFAVKAVSINDIDSLQEMQQYKAILNPYGEGYPETACTPNPSAPGGYDCNILDNIREYVKGGGYWLESGGWSFYYSCGSAPDLNSNADNHVCVDIGTESTSPRAKDAAYSSIIQNSPASITGSARPSIGMTGNCGDNQNFKGLYKYSSPDRYGPAMHCYGTGCIVRTDNTDTDTATVYSDILRTQVR